MTRLGVACAEIIKDHKALTYSLKPKDLEDAAENACKLKTSEINTIFPDVSCLLHVLFSVLCESRGDVLLV
jgi:hypothetical protein